MKQLDKILSEALVRKGILPSERIQECAVIAQSQGKSLEHYLIEKNILPRQEILDVLASELKCSAVNLRTVPIDRLVIEKIPVKFVLYYKFMPIKIENKTLTIAVSNPLDVKVQDEIRVHLGMETSLVLSTEQEIQDAIRKHYGLGAATIEQILTKDQTRGIQRRFEEREVEDIEEKTDDASVTQLVNQIIFEAYQKRATDIHIEPYRDKVRFRYRIDGVLIDANLPSNVKHFVAPIISRIKIMANLSIVEKRLPQDGSAVVKTKEQTLDLRVSTIPTPRGESIVVRILPSKVMIFSLEKLGLSEKGVAIFRKLIDKPHGIIFVTGPTGSGKTTTLYAALNEVNSSERKIITIEDPVEYEMEGITQIQVNPKIDLDFARGLRSILRHDPDIIMVGEVRDLETAEIAIRTALTGHLVFSTLHTNDAASGITRLMEMGVEPFLVTSSIEALVAQRLVRVICPRCKEEDRETPPELRQEISISLGMDDPKKLKIFKGRGCEHCNNTGFYGRTAIYEILVLDETIKTAILEKTRVDHIRQLALKNGMRTLRHDGWLKVASGMTTPSEVLNVTTEEDLLKTEQEGVITSQILSNQQADEHMLQQRYRIIPKNILLAENEYDSRVYQRIQIKVPVKYKLLYGEEEDPLMLTVKGVEHSTVTKDLSAGGLMLIAGHGVSIGSILEIKIQLEEKTKYVDCLAKVCRIDENSLTNLYNIVAYFLDISSADRVRINNFVRAQLKDRKEA